MIDRSSRGANVPDGRTAAFLFGVLVVCLWGVPVADTWSAHADVSFIATQDFLVGRNPQSVATGELNGDDRQDLIVANQGSNHVSVLLGRGNGNFQPAQNFVVPGSPRSAAVGDFNVDGFQDLAAVHTQAAGSILLGNGDGTFQPAQTFAAGGFSNQSITVGDFNWDRLPDLTVVLIGSGPVQQGAVHILLGNGDGTFQPPRAFSTGRASFSAIVDDFNGDGRQDLAVANAGSDNVSILLGNGDGTFQAARNFRAGSIPVSLTVGDFNGDGFQDLAVANRFSESVSVLIGNGDGTFQAPQDVGLGKMSTSVSVGDFNGDEVQDLAVAVLGSIDAGSPGSVQILLGACPSNRL